MRSRDLQLAAVLAIAAFACDCLDELDPPAGAPQPPSSLRGSAAVAIALLTLPPLLAQPFLVGVQYAASLALIIALAMLATHVGGMQTRASEALFGLISLSMVVAPTAIDGVARIFAVRDGGERNTRLLGVATRAAPTLAILAYVGGCLLRAGAFGCREAYERAQWVGGCVACDATLSACVAAIGGACVAAAASSLWCLLRGRNDDARVVGLVGVATLVALVLRVLYSVGDALAANPEAFDAPPLLAPECDPTEGETAACPDGLRGARRTGLLLWSLGAAVFATLSLSSVCAGLVGPGRPASRAVEAWAVAIACVAALVIQLPGAAWEGRGAFTEASFVLATVGIGMCAFVNEVAGATVAYAGLYLDSVAHMGGPRGIAYDYYTTITNLVLGVGFVVHLVLLVATTVQIPFVAGWARYLATLECNAMRGLAVALALATTAAFVLYDGRDLRDLVQPETGSTLGRAAQYHQTVTRIVVWHYVPPILWALLQRRVGDAERLGACAHWLSWVAGLVLSGIVYAIVLATRGNGLPSVYPVSDGYPMAVSFVALILAPFVMSA